MSIILGVEITAKQVLCGCYRKSRGKCDLLWVDQMDLHNTDPAQAIESLKTKHHLKKARLHMAVSNDQVQQFVLGNIVYHGADVYQKLVHAHLMQHAKQPFEELAFDYVRCAKDRLWVMCMPKQDIDQYLSWSKSLKLSLNELEPSLCGLFRLLPQEHASQFSLLYVRDATWHFAICDGVDVVFEQSRSFEQGAEGLVEWVQSNFAQYALKPFNINASELYVFTDADQGFDVVSNIEHDKLKVTWINHAQFNVPDPEYLIAYGCAIKGE